MRHFKTDEPNLCYLLEKVPDHTYHFNISNLGRKSHPNPYHFASTVKTALAHTSQKIAWVEQGTFENLKRMTNCVH